MSLVERAMQKRAKAARRLRREESDKQEHAPEQRRRVAARREESDTTEARRAAPSRRAAARPRDEDYEDTHREESAPRARRRAVETHVEEERRPVPRVRTPRPAPEEYEEEDFGEFPDTRRQHRSRDYFIEGEDDFEDDYDTGEYDDEDDFDYEVAPRRPGYSTGFDLDQAWLKEQGFFTPDNKDKRLALELRAIKRRLLRRLHFYRLDAEKRRRKTGRDRQRNTVLVTSTRPAEGKSFTAINLALSLAIEDNINVLLVDADVPRPKVFHHLGLEPGLGLTDRILDPSLPVSELIRRERTWPLSVMSQGTERSSPTEVFSRDEMSQFIDEMSLRYPDRVIIFDAPPVLATPEAVVLAKHVDEVVFVVEANKTPEPAVATAVDEILDNNARVSMVLNKCLAPEAASHYGSYEEYYNKAGTTRSSGDRRRKRQ